MGYITTIMSILTEQELIAIINNPENHITDVKRNADQKIVEFKAPKSLEEIVGRTDLDRKEAYACFEKNRPATYFKAYERVSEPINLQWLLTTKQQELFKNDTGSFIPVYQVTFDSILSMLKGEGFASDILQNALKWRKDGKSFEVALNQWVDSLTVLQGCQYEYVRVYSSNYSKQISETFWYKLPSGDVMAKRFKKQFQTISHQCIQNPRVRDKIILILTLDANAPNDWKFLLAHNYDNSLKGCYYLHTLNAIELGGNYTPIIVSHELDHALHNLLHIVIVDDCEECMAEFGKIPFTRKLLNLPEIADKMIQVSRKEMEAFWGYEASKLLQFTNSQIEFSKRVLCEHYFMKAVWAAGEEIFTRMGVNVLSDHNGKVGIFFNPFSEIGEHKAVIWGYPMWDKIVKNDVYDTPRFIQDNVMYMLPDQDGGIRDQFPVAYLNPELKEAVTTIADNIKAKGFPVPAEDIQCILFKILKVTTDIHPCLPVNPEGTKDDFYSNLSQLLNTCGLKSAEDYKQA